jgi:hypothetical protein
MANFPDSFYITLFSNTSQHLYADNTIAAYTTRLAHPVQVGCTDDWEVGVCELSYPQPTTITVKPVVIVGETHGILYCDLIKPQLVGGSIARSMRTFIYPSIYCQHTFYNVYYLPVEKGTFQDKRIEILTTEGERVKIKDSTSPSKVVLHFRRRRAYKI